MKKAVIISCFNWYDSRLKYIKEVLCKHSFDVTILSSDFNHITREKEREFDDVHYISVKEFKKNISVKRLYSHYDFSNQVYQYLNENEFDLIYCLLPPNHLAKSLGKIKKTKKYEKSILFFDIIDLWPEAFPLRGLENNPFFKKWKALRNNNLNLADRVFVECNLYKQKLYQIVDESKLKTLYLTSPNDYFINDLSQSEDEIVFCYLGSINNLIDIDLICKVITLAKKFKPVTLNIIGGGSKADEFIKKAQNSGATVNNIGICYDLEVIKKVLGSSHFGLNMYKTNSVGLTIKSIDYLSAGLPLINSIKGDTWELVNQRSIGVNIDDINHFDFSFDIEKKNKAHKVFTDNFSVNAFKNTFETELKAVLENRRN